MLDPKYVIRYYISWIEALDPEEAALEEKITSLLMRGLRGNRELPPMLCNQQEVELSGIDGDDMRSTADDTMGARSIIRLHLAKQLSDTSESVSESKLESLVSQDTFFADSKQNNNYQLIDPKALQESGAVFESMIAETLNEYIKVGLPFTALNLMIQTEYCSGNTLRDYIL